MSKLEDNLKANIKNTGFPLEYKIASVLRKNAWTVISNKYYIDDLSEVVREIDLVAYKVLKTDAAWIYTTIFLSCKKSAENVWAFLSHKPDEENPNTNWDPIHLWTNKTSLNYLLRDELEWKNRYFNEVVTDDIKPLFEMPSRQIFAFQEMSRKNGKPQNDKNIFNSITTLMKAQAFEISALPDRKKVDAFYQFNLVSITDTELFDLYFSDSDIEIESIDGAVYVADYIINTAQTFSRIHFVKPSGFEQLLNQFNILHRQHVKRIPKIDESFYKDIMKDSIRSELLLPAFNKFIKTSNKFWGLKMKYDLEAVIATWIYWSEAKQEAMIDLDIPSDSIDEINESDRMMATLNDGLRTIYRYQGDFSVLSGIPF